MCRPEIPALQRPSALFVEATGTVEAVGTNPHGTASTTVIVVPVVRLSLGKLLLVNLLQVVKRTNTPLIPQQMASSAGPCFFLVSWVRILPSTIINFFRLSLVELENNLPGIPRN